MLVDYEKALAVFDTLKEDQKAPSLHPYYVVADAQRDKTLQPIFFVYEEGRSLYYHAFHRAPVKETSFFDIQSPYGYGGPLSTSYEEGFLSNAWSAYTAWCEDNDILAEFIRFHPLLKNWRYYPGEVIDERETVWLDLHNETVSSAYRDLAKRGIKKAQKNGVTVEWWDGEEFLHIFPLLYDVFMTELGADEFYRFTKNYFKTIVSWEKTHCAVCKLDDEIITAGVFLIDAATMEYHLSASYNTGKESGSVYLLMHEAALRGQQRGCQVLHLGGGTDNNPDNPLLFFKSRFSPLRGSFKIGKKIHAIQPYNQMKEEWHNKQGVAINRILFYR